MGRKGLESVERECLNKEILRQLCHGHPFGRGSHEGMRHQIYRIYLILCVLGVRVYRYCSCK